MLLWGLKSTRLQVTAVSLGLAGLAGLCGCESSRNRCDCGCVSIGSSAYYGSPTPGSHAPTAETPPGVDGVADATLPSPTETAARFASLGGSTEFDARDQIAVLDLSDAQATDADLRSGQGLEHLAQLDLSNTLVTDAALADGRWLQNLQRLSLNNTQITDEGLRGLQGLSQIRLLWLNQTGVSDAGLSHLAGLTGLESLGLNETAITNAGLMHLHGMKDLKYLLLSQTEISDEGLIHLTGLKALKGLSLVGTQVTAEGVAALRQDLPDCEIVSDADKAAVDIEEDVDNNSEVTPSGYDIPSTFDSEFSDQEAPRLLPSWEPQSPLASTDAVDITRFYIGLAFAQTGDIDAALPLFTETVGAAAAHYNLGVVLCEAGHRSVGEEHFRIALEIDPSLSVTRDWLETVMHEADSSDGLSAVSVEVE